MEKKAEERIKEIRDWLDTECYAYVVMLLFSCQNVTLTKVRMLNYLFKHNKEGLSINQVSKDLKIDYKNVYRIIKEFKKAKILTSNEKVGKGNNSNISLVNLKGLKK